ncbi:proteolipid membrane potential modulator domain-containing protein [Sarocladium implicatum]|nr:proteolipid membrane potential modulator domain-containing protein [Sarocladium implicatum]
MCCSADIFLGVIAILFPPLPVWVKRGICSADSIINILLCVLGFIPGLLHSWYIIAKFPEPPYEYETVPQDSEGGRVTYVYVQNHPGGNNGRQQQQRQPKPQDNGTMNYGTAGQNGGSSSGGDGGEGGVPPSYASVVAGGNKVQSHQ